MPSCSCMFMQMREAVWNPSGTPLDFSSSFLLEREKKISLSLRPISHLKMHWQSTKKEGKKYKLEHNIIGEKEKEGGEIKIPTGDSVGRFETRVKHAK